jgi:hypothetical protein
MTTSNQLRAAALLAMLCGCFNGSTYTPIISTVFSTSPSVAETETFGQAVVATGATQLSLSGLHFAADTVVYWNGKPLTTHYQSDTALTADVDASLTQVAGTAAVTAKSEASFLSAPYTARLVDADFSVTSVAPQPLTAGAAGATLIITGTGYKPVSLVTWNGASMTVKFVSSTSLSIDLPAALVAEAGDNLVQVTQQSCNGAPFCQPFTLRIVAAVGPSTRHTLQQTAHDVVWDATHSLLFVSNIGFATASTITAVDPVTATTGVSITTDQANQISISDQDQFLYTAGNAVTRYALPGLTSATSIPAVADFDPNVAAAPGAPATFAFLNLGQLGVVDGTIGRTKLASLDSGASFAWGFDTSTLYGIPAFTPGLFVFNVDQSGVTKGSTLLSTTQFPDGSSLHYDRTLRRIFFSTGENFDEQGGDPRPFPVSTPTEFNSCQVAIDSALGKAFFACTDPVFGLNVRAFDLQTQQMISRIILDPTSDAGEASRVVRWGTSGLAIPTNSQLYLYDGAFVH